MTDPAHAVEMASRDMADARPECWERRTHPDAVGKQRALLAVLGRDLGVDAELAAGQTISLWREDAGALRRGLARRRGLG